jgi:drug/metabolite transporter (DMT)-like permease
VPIPRRTLIGAIVASILSAFLWATYYLFVLWVTPGTAPSAILFYPFLAGAVAYAAWTVAAGHGREFARLWRDPAAYGRASLLYGMQASVLAATYLTGPVDASLLSLIGDVVLTPIIVAAFLASYRPHIATPMFAAGLVISLLGGAMAIVGGQSLSSVHGWGWFCVPGVPLFVATYFLWAARANRTTAPSAVVAHSMCASTILFLVTAPLFPGGWSGLVSVAPVPLFLLVLCGLTSFFLAPALYFAAIQDVGLVIPPMLMTAIPVFTLLLSSEVLGIALPLVGVLGIPVAVVGAILALRGQSASPSDDVPAAASPGS